MQTMELTEWGMGSQTETNMPAAIVEKASISRMKNTACITWEIAGGKATLRVLYYDGDCGLVAYSAPLELDYPQDRNPIFEWATQSMIWIRSGQLVQSIAGQLNRPITHFVPAWDKEVQIAYGLAGYKPYDQAAGYFAKTYSPDASSERVISIGQ